jgi:microcystin-dependent protein
MPVSIAGSVGVTYPDLTVQTSASTVPAGTLMLFVQTAAPTGWTKSTTHDNKALRIVSGTASTGGSVAFTTAFASGLSAGATTLSTAQMPAHTHSAWSGQTAPNLGGSSCGGPQFPTSTSTSGSQGGGGSHDHTLPSFAVQYVDVIIATKN